MSVGVDARPRTTRPLDPAVSTLHPHTPLPVIALSEATRQSTTRIEKGRDRMVPIAPIIHHPPDVQAAEDLRLFILAAQFTELCGETGKVAARQQASLFNPAVPFDPAFEIAKEAIDFGNIRCAPSGHLVKARDAE